jgi:hypothetical protein
MRCVVEWGCDAMPGLLRSRSERMRHPSPRSLPTCARPSATRLLKTGHRTGIERAHRLHVQGLARPLQHERLERRRTQRQGVRVPVDGERVVVAESEERSLSGRGLQEEVKKVALIKVGRDGGEVHVDEHVVAMRARIEPVREKVH